MKTRHTAVLKWALLLLGWGVLLGWLAPLLVSQADTFAVLLGGVLLLAYTYFTYVLIDAALERAFCKSVTAPPPTPPIKEKQ